MNLFVASPSFPLLPQPLTVSLCPPRWVQRSFRSEVWAPGLGYQATSGGQQQTRFLFCRKNCRNWVGFVPSALLNLKMTEGGNDRDFRMTPEVRWSSYFFSVVHSCAFLKQHGLIVCSFSFCLGRCPRQVVQLISLASLKFSVCPLRHASCVFYCGFACRFALLSASWKFIVS